MPSGPSNYFFQQGVTPMFESGINSISLPVTLKPSTTFPRGTVLGEMIGANEVDTLTITGAPTGGTFTLTVNGQTTAAIAYNAQPSAVASALNALSQFSTSTVETITQSGATGGNFILSVGSAQTAPIAYNASAATVQAALAALPNVGTGNVACSGGALGSSAVTVTFQGALTGVWMPLLGVQTAGLLVGGSVTVAYVSQGGGSGQEAACTGTQLPGGTVTITFQNEAGNQPQVLTHTDSLTGGTSPAVSITRSTTGSAGTIGQFAPYVSTNTDGSQVPKAILQFDCTTDSSGNITFGWQTGGQGGGGFGQTSLTAPAWFKGMFRAADLVGLDSNCFSNGMKLVSGDLANPLQCVVSI